MNPSESTAGAAVCPSCERFMGPAAVCPYCDADSRHHPFVRRIRYSALFLALAGLVLLYVMARHRDTPLVRVGQINPAMNFGCVRVNGTVSRRPYVSREADRVDYVSFLVDDGTGSLRVAAYRDVARVLEAADRLPTKGQSVEVSGVLTVSGDGDLRLRLRSPEHVKMIAGVNPAGGS